MSIAIDTSTQLAWAIANTEAFLASDTRIRPIHFLLGILKVVDPRLAEQVRSLGVSERQRKNLAETGTAARHYLEMTPDDIATFRRKLRKTLRANVSTPNTDAPLPVLHRDDRSRAVFVSLAKHASASRQQRITALSLLVEMVRTNAIDLEAIWQKAVKGKGQSIADGKQKWSTGRKWDIDDNGLNSPDLSSDLPKALDGHGRNLTQLAKNGELCPVLGRKREMAAISRYLCRVSKRSVLLVAAPGVGKTSIIEGLAQTLCRPTANKSLRNVTIVQVTAGELMLALLADGPKTTAIRMRLNSLVGTDNLVLAIENFDRLLKPDHQLEAAAELLRNAIARGEIACLGAITKRGFGIMDTAHDSFTDSLNIVTVEEMSLEESLPIVELWAKLISESHGVRFAGDTVKRAVEIAAEKIPQGVLPAKAIDLLENAAVFRRVTMLSSSVETGRPEAPLVSSDLLREVIQEQYGIDLGTNSTNKEM